MTTHLCNHRDRSFSTKRGLNIHIKSCQKNNVEETVPIEENYHTEQTKHVINGVNKMTHKFKITSTGCMKRLFTGGKTFLCCQQEKQVYSLLKK